MEGFGPIQGLRQRQHTKPFKKIQEFDTIKELSQQQQVRPYKQIQSPLNKNQANQLVGEGFYHPFYKSSQKQQLGLQKKKIKKNMDKLFAMLAILDEKLGAQLIQKLMDVFWVVVALIFFYFSDFFYYLRSPEVSSLCLQIFLAAYAIVISSISLIISIIPRIPGIVDHRKYTSKIQNYTVVVLPIGLISFTIAIWSVWGWWSLLILIILWKFYASLHELLLPDGILWDILFPLLNFAMLSSVYYVKYTEYIFDH